MLGKQTIAYKQIEEHTTRILKGVVVSIDPSIGSSSSMPGWAVSRKGELVDSGILQINPTDSVPVRLQKLAYLMRTLYRKWDPDILVYEEIPAQRHGGGNANAHSSLLKAVGTILSISGPDGYVGLHPLSWKKLVRDSYVKGDEEDAREMLWIVINEARKMQEQAESPRRRYGKKVG